MKTVKEVSNLTGISVRTLHYYDEIGLLKPMRSTEAGYRLYDGKALEDLQQILFFREFDMPLKAIKSLMENPELDRKLLLRSQKNVLVLKKERLERIISSIDSVLKGENNMDFTVFSQTEIEKMYQSILNNSSEEQKEIFEKEFGSMENFEKHFLETAKTEQAQKQLAKVVEWYGDKESTMAAARNSNNSEIVNAYASRFEKVIEKLAAKTGADVNSFEVKEIVGELDFVGKQLYQMKDMSAFMLDISNKYQTCKGMQARLDEKYGDGSTLFIGQALEAFYKPKA